MIPEAAVACSACGGSGDAFDRALDDWVRPRANCKSCEGSGEAWISVGNEIQ